MLKDPASRFRREEMAYSRVIAVITLLAFLPLSSSPAWAEPISASKTNAKKSGSSKSGDPTASKPSAPPALTHEVPKDTFRCDRQFRYRGKLMSCDSFYEQDGERLRPLFEGVPEALSELNLYQQNRRGVRTAAYFGTLGLVIALAGFIVGSQIKEPDPVTGQLVVSQTGITIRTVSLVSGLGVTVGSMVWSFSVIKGNESHLGTAVEKYNAAHPESPIELQFSTGFTF